VSADLVAACDAPDTLTRPWISVPIVVKKRRLSFSIGDWYSPSSSMCA
jgi:hypothetical protein